MLKHLPICDYFSITGFQIPFGFSVVAVAVVIIVGVSVVVDVARAVVADIVVVVGDIVFEKYITSKTQITQTKNKNKK